jgi:hypothetical protein
MKITEMATQRDQGMDHLNAPTRPLLPSDVTLDELWWLYHNHPVLHQFIERIVAEAELNWQRHHNFPLQ